MRFVLFLIACLPAIAGEFTTALGAVYPYMVSAIATDSAGNTYVVGSRQLGGGVPVEVIGVLSPTPLPPVIVSPYFYYGGSDVFVSKLDPNGKVLFTDTFAGKGVDTGTAIALDPSGNIYIAGTTTSPDFPLSKALQTQPNANGTGFVIKLTNDGSTILYSTYFGGELGQTSISSLATDANGNLYLTGTTNAADFPHTTGMPFGQVKGQGAPPLIGGAIIASISAAGDKILYAGALVGSTLTCSEGSSCFFAPRITTGIGISVDAAGNAYVAGNTNATDLPTTTGALSSAGFGAFIAKVNPGGGGLSYLTYLSPGQLGLLGVISAESTLSAIEVDAAGNAYLAGSTNDSNFPATAGSFQPAFGGPPSTSGAPPSTPEAFLARLKPDGSQLAWATYLGGAGQAAAQSIAVDASGNVWSTGTAASATFPNANGWSAGTEFLVGLNSAGSKLTYSALYPAGTIAQSIALDPSGLIHVAGSNGFISAISPTTAPTMKLFDFQNAFGGNVTARISPAEVISIYGPGIGPSAAATAAPTSGFYPKTLAGVQLTINGMNMPLLYVSANQINAVVPMEIAPEASATVRVINGTAVSPDYPVWILAAAPQAFPTVVNQDGTINSQTNPAKGASTVTFYATGWQSNFSPLADGQVATVAEDACQGACQAFSNSNLNGPTATVLYGGAAPGIVAGVTQFNVHIGALPAPLSLIPFNFNVTGPSTVAETVWIKP